MFSLLRAALLLIQRDPVVLYPAMIGGFASTWFIKFFPATVTGQALASYFIFSWLSNLFIQLVSAEIGQALLKQKIVKVGTVLKTAFLRFFPSMLWTGLCLILGGGLFLLSGKNLLIKIAALPIIIGLLSIVQIYPIGLVASEASSLAMPKIIIGFLRYRLPAFLRILVFLTFTSLLFLLAGALIQAIPAPYRDLILSLLQGWINVVICYGLLLLWQETSTKPKVIV
jgi:hypothetical protein